MPRKYLLKKVTGELLKLKIPYDKELNAEQYAVVLQGDGPCLVLAGAGTGKTRTLIYRVAYLLEKGVPPQNILLMTFTNRAARQMQDRIEQLIGYHPNGLWCGTFHHIGNRSLRMYTRQAGLLEGFGILDEEDSRDLIKQCLQSLSFKTTEARLPKPRVIKAILSYAVNTKSSIQDVVTSYYPYFAHRIHAFEQIQKVYSDKKRKTNNLDFDDLLIRWIKLLEESEEVKARCCEQFRYILVDEYQDTNCLQYDIVRLLSSHHKNLLVVGDDAQSIYSFRGAEIHNILDFSDAFSKTKVFKLETNYRSSPEILHLANESIRHNLHQFPKELKSTQSSALKPQRVRVRDPAQQAAFIAQRILELRDEGIDLRDMAVLFRARYHSAELELELSRRGIPYIIRGGVRFFEQAHIKDALSYLRIIQNPLDELSWTRALTLHEGIGSRFSSKIFQQFIQAGSNFAAFFKSGEIQDLPPKVQNGFLQFKRIIKSILKSSAPQSPDQMIQAVLDNGYQQYLLLNFENAQDRLSDLKELVNFAHTYKSLKDFLGDVTLREGFKGETILGTAKDEEYLVLSTIHQAKGLEWKVVMGISLSEGQFPHPKVVNDDEGMECEEERRLFYVMATRAKQELYLVHPMTRTDHEMGSVICRPSLFLEELPGSCYELCEVGETTEEEIIHLD